MILRSYAQLDTLVASLKKKKKKLVWTNGCFDLLHYGHVMNLTKAKALGDVLIVGLNGDRSPYFNSKPGRPLQTQKARSESVQALKAVDHVFIFQEETPLKAIERVIPDVLVKGGDYSKETIVGAEFVKKNGGRVRRIPLVPGYSTTSLIQKILKTYSK